LRTPSATSRVTNYQIYAGLRAVQFQWPGPHYFLRRGAHIADIQVNLLPKGDRSAQSHDIAKRVRRASTKSPEVPRPRGGRRSAAGPPVLQTLVAEIYGPRIPHERN